MRGTCTDGEQHDEQSCCQGIVMFYMTNGRSLTLTDVRHVPSLQKNLIFIGILNSKGCSFEVSGGTLRVFKENKEMLRRRKI